MITLLARSQYRCITHFNSIFILLPSFPFSPPISWSPSHRRRIYLLASFYLFLCSLYFRFLIWAKPWDTEVCVSGFVPLALWPQVPPIFLQMTQICASLQQNSTAVCINSTLYLLLMDTQAASQSHSEKPHSIPPGGCLHGLQGCEEHVLCDPACSGASVLCGGDFQKWSEMFTSVTSSQYVMLDINKDDKES